MDLSQITDIIKYTKYYKYINDLSYIYNCIVLSKQDNNVMYEIVIRSLYSSDHDRVFIVTTKNGKITNINIPKLTGRGNGCEIRDNGLIEIIYNDCVIKYVCVGVYKYWVFERIYKVNDTFKTEQYSEVVRYVRNMMPDILLKPLMQIVLDYFIVKAI
jgi:hypothetical protein